MTDAVAARDETTENAARRLRRHGASERRWSALTLYLGLAIVLGFITVGIAAPLIGIADPYRQDLISALQPPSVEHLFGTDSLGRDIFGRVIYAIRTDFAFGLVTTYVPMMIGLIAGAVAGYLGGWLDGLIMRLVDVLIAFPYIVIILALASVFGAGLFGAYVGVIIVSWTIYARLTRGEMLVLREQQYVLAAKTLGFSTSRIVLRHALPNAIRPSLVFSMADLVLNILTLASLSYLGLGVQPPTPEWGALIADGRGYLLTAWWISTLPGLVVVLAGVGFSLIGDGLADRLGGELKLTA